jgi:ubiquinone/menaquinone biosynthesis C-methylase UbiE
MIIWLASYPRSGNTLLRVILNHIFGLKTWSLYNDTLDLGADQATAEIVGHQFLDQQFNSTAAAADDRQWLIKTHDYPEHDQKAIYIVRDGRETLTSYLFYFKNILKQEKRLSDLIAGSTPFGSWSDHLLAWHPLVREHTLLLRFEDIIDDVDACIVDIAEFLKIDPISRQLPTFAELQAINPKFFRNGKRDSWKTVFNKADHALFWELHGSAMIEYGYAASAPDWRAVRTERPWSLVVTPAEARAMVPDPELAVPSLLPPDPFQADKSRLGMLVCEHNLEIMRLRAALVGLQRDLERSESDRTARLEVIEHQGAELGRIPVLEADVAYLKDQLAATEADRAARLAVIERQGAELDARLAAAEADRAARLAVIERQGADLGQLHQRLAQLEQQVETASQLLSDTRTGTLLRVMRPAWWRRLQTTLDEAAALGRLNGLQQPGDGQGASYALDSYVAEIDRLNRAQPNAELLNAIRAYNHRMVEELNKLRSLRGLRLLDIGASPHGYALEHALRLGAADYVGVGLDVAEPIEVHAAKGAGRLLRMDATHLDFEDESFDLVISLSTFEHIGDVAAALQEIRRILKIGGHALISFEPVWTCSYGHHLHHFGPVSRLMPDWAHLVWDEQQMLRELAAVWPADAPLTLEDAAHWVYESTAINRIGIVQMREHFASCGLAIDWIAPIQDEARDPARLREVATAVALSPDDLMVKGLSVFLKKISQH